MSGEAAAALGFAARTGWAAMVALAGPISSPRVLDRRRVELATGDLPRQAYHAARHLPPAEASALVDRAHAAARAAAHQAVRAAVEDLEQSGHRVVSTGLLLAATRPPDALDQILASHAAMHAAEGELSRDALADALETCGLSVTATPRRFLSQHAAALLGLPPDDTRAHLTALGKPLGPPWRQEHKEAALLAWLALATEPRPGGRGVLSAP